MSDLVGNPEDRFSRVEAQMTRDWESLLLANAKPYVQGTREHATVQWTCFSSEKENNHCHFTASDHIYWLAMPYPFQKP